MENLYWEQFVDYAKLAKRSANHKFQINMEEIQNLSVNFIPLDVQKDPPLPDWAKRILFESHLSKRTRLLLLQYHDKKIRLNRLHSFTQQGTIQNEQTERTEDFSDSDEDEE